MKVFERTRDRVQLASGVLRKTQAEIMEAAVDEYIERHAEDFVLGLKLAREALLAGPVETAAYLLDENPEKLRRVAGREDASPIRVRRAARPNPTEGRE
jgi:hypothetical protein